MAREQAVLPRLHKEGNEAISTGEMLVCGTAQ
jgi:hypothetical protein